jgi:hypothetical protein
MMRSLPESSIFFTGLAMFSGARNWPCLMLTTAPVFAAATTSSDCMHKYAGIWITSQTSAAGAA